MGSDPRLYVVMVHVERFLRGIHVKMAPHLRNISSNPKEYPVEFPIEYHMEYPGASYGIPWNIQR